MKSVLYSKHFAGIVSYQKMDYSALISALIIFRAVVQMSVKQLRNLE